MMFRLISVISTLTLATGAHAQDVYGSVSLGWSSIEDADVEVTSSSLFGDIGVDYGQLDIYFSGSKTSIGSDGLPDDVILTSGSAVIGYEFMPAIRADLSYSSADLSFDTLSIDASVVEAGLSYEMSGFFGRASYADVDDEFDSLESVTSLAVGYEFNEGSSVVFSVHDLEDTGGLIDELVYIGSFDYENEYFEASIDYISFEQDAVDLSLMALAGSYNVTPTFEIRGGYAVASLDGEDIDLTSVGVGYEMSDTFEAFADFSKVEATGYEADGFSVGVQYTFGDKPAKSETTIDRISSPLSVVGGNSL